MNATLATDEESIEEDPPITWERATAAWEQATGLTDTEDGGLTTALLREVICGGSIVRTSEPGPMYRLRRVIEDLTQWQQEMENPARAPLQRPRINA